MSGPRVKPRVLIVEDDSSSLVLARTVLEGAGFEVVEATTGAEGLQAFIDSPPACALLDIRLPDYDGIALCEQIRQLPRGSETPIIFMTAVRDLDTFERAIAAGANEFVTKPINPGEFSLRVRSTLELQLASGELKLQYETLQKERAAMVRLELLQERLMSFLVHDLKTPVSTIDLNVQLLLREPELTAPMRTKLQRIRSETGNMIRLIMSLLDIGRAESGTLAAARRSVDTQRLVADVASSFEAKAADANITLTVGDEWPAAVGDVTLLRRVLHNLVDNAIRHCPRHEVVKIAADSSPEGTRIYVQDCGPGIPAELKDKVFDRFFQAEQPRADRTNRGLGLTFCRLAVEAQGGRIWVEDARPGARFCINLPHATSATAREVG